MANGVLAHSSFRRKPESSRPRWTPAFIGVAFFCATLLCGCVTTSIQPRPVDNRPLLPPSSVSPHNVNQVLHAAFGDRDVQLQSILNAKPDEVTVIGVTALGLRAFTLKYNGVDLQEQRAAELPAAINGRQLLNDVQLAFWPLQALQAAWQPAGWEVSEPQSGTRRLRKQGRLIAEVHYADADPWNGRLWLSNFAYGYSLYIESTPAGAP